jgi:NADPH-dependent curcumin reductase
MSTILSGRMVKFDSPLSKEVPMVTRVNRQILLKSRPEGAPSLDNFTLKQGSVPEPGDGEVLMRTRWLSLDPYMRGRMSAAKSYAKPVEVGATMVGGTVGEVVASRNPNFAVGDIVMGYCGWQDYAVANGSGLRKLNPAAAPVSTALGVLGMPGMTAYAGLLEIGRPQAGETVAVACGRLGCRADRQDHRHRGRTGQVPLRGGRIGLRCLRGSSRGRLRPQTRSRVPGRHRRLFRERGAVQQTVWPLLNDFARVPVCG